MFCQAVMGARQAGQAERGTMRLKGSADVSGAAPAASSSHSARHCLSSITGRRWMTTFKKLPISSPTARHAPMKSAGSAAKTSIRRNAVLDDRTQLEDGQGHRNHESADEDAQDHHDERLPETRHGIDSVVDFRFVEGCDFAGHGIERA